MIWKEFHTLGAMVNAIYLLTSRDLCLDVWLGSGYGLVLCLLASCSPVHPLQMGTFLVLTLTGLTPHLLSHS